MYRGIQLKASRYQNGRTGNQQYVPSDTYELELLMKAKDAINMGNTTQSVYA